jgi:hypothetical protein
MARVLLLLIIEKKSTHHLTKCVYLQGNNIKEEGKQIYE